MTDHEAPSAVPPADAAELRALRLAVGVADRSDAGRLDISGADALDLLNRLTTNALEELPDGRSKWTVLTNGDARVIDLLALGALDGRLLCLTSPGRAAEVVDWLDMYTFGEEIEVVDQHARHVPADPGRPRGRSRAQGGCWTLRRLQSAGEGQPRARRRRGRGRRRLADAQRRERCL